MNKEDLHVFGLVEFRPDQGAIFFRNRRLVMMSSTTFGEWERDLANTLGEQQARKMILRKGYKDGFQYFVIARQLFGQHQGYIVCPRLSELMGIAKVEVPLVSEGAAAYKADVRLYNSVEAEEHLFLAGHSTAPVCSWLGGFASGYASAERGLEIYFKELECVACGYPRCTMVGQDADSWGEELPQLRDQYGFRNFAEVEAYWTERRERSAALLAHREKLFSACGSPEAAADDGIRARTAKAIEDGHFIVREPAMLEILDQAVCVARLNSPVLVQGETGTGKEFLVNLIHQHSARADRKLVSVNCAAFAESLLESELFGHTRGAFTGAVSDKPGLFELAADGTLFLDELGEMPLGLQAKLLRAIENGEIRRVGSNKTIKVNPRFVAATNQNLKAMIAAGKFREDLYFRLNSFVIQLPPLRERQDSIAPMVQQFLQEVTSNFDKTVTNVSPEAMACLIAYRWPGNVRELKHAIERAVVVTRGQTIQVRDLPPEIQFCDPTREDQDDNRARKRRSERQLIAQAIAEHRGDREATARALDISVATLYRKLSRYGLKLRRDNVLEV